MHLISFDVINQEALALLNVALNESLIILWSITNILDASVVMSCPEERNVFEGDFLAHHVESSMRALIHSCDVMLNSKVSIEDMVRIRYIISSSKDIWDSCL